MRKYAPCDKHLLPVGEPQGASSFYFGYVLWEFLFKSPKFWGEISFVPPSGGTQKKNALIL